MNEARKPILSSGFRTSHDGFDFDPGSNGWRLSRDVYFEISKLRNIISENLFQGFIAALSDTATTHSAKHTINMYSAFCHMVRTIALGTDVQALTTVDFINFKSTLTKRTEWNLGRLVGFIKKWSKARHPGLAPDVVPLLKSWTLACNPKGEAVLLRCPRSGPLTPMEYELLQARLLDGLDDQHFSLEEYALTALVAGSARRPAQVADGKWCDFNDSLDLRSPAFLLIARRKGQGKTWRSDLKPFEMSPELALTFRTLYAETQNRARELIPQITEEQLRMLPIFVRWKRLMECTQSSRSVLDAVLAGQHLHRQSHDLGQQLTRTIDRLVVRSDRVPNPIRVTPIRLRRTLATRAARLGLSKLVIAELLDHSDTQSAGVYTENVPENVDPLNEAVGNQIAPLMKAFRGEIIESEKFAARATDKKSRIRTDEGTQAGNCSRCDSCVARAPIACYTCRAFQPWLDGDHKAVLNQLLKERAACSDPVIAETCDLSIFAVREVIRLCELRQAPIKSVEG